MKKKLIHKIIILFVAVSMSFTGMSSYVTSAVDINDFRGIKDASENDFTDGGDISETGDCYDGDTEPVNLKIDSMILKKAPFSSGMTITDAYLYPSPSKQAYEYGRIYKGRIVRILGLVETNILDESQSSNISSVEKYYMVSYTCEKAPYIHVEQSEDSITFVGFVACEAISGKIDQRIAEGPWKLKNGVEYYELSETSIGGKQNMELKMNSENSMPMMLWGTVHREDVNMWYFWGSGGGPEILIDDLHKIMPLDSLGPGRTCTAG